MNLKDIIYENAQFECIECSDSTDNNGVTSDTQLTINVTFLGYETEVKIWPSDFLELGTDMSSKYAIEKINQTILEDELEYKEFTKVSRID